MAKKRKADADDDGAAPAKKVHWKAKAGEKSNEIVTRMEALGLQYSKDHEEDEDPQNRSINDLDAEWVEKFAQHLVREPSFLEIMQNAPEPKAVRIAKWWIASVRLGRLYKRYNTFQQFDKKIRKEIQDAAVERAINILEETVSIVQTSTTKTSVQPPPDDDAAKSLRETLFFYHTLRSRVIGAIKAANDQEYVLMSRLVSSGNSFDLDVLNELELLEEVKDELRNALQTQPEATGKEVIDNLLMNVPDNGRPLYQLPADVVKNGLDRPTPPPASAPPSTVFDASKGFGQVVAVEDQESLEEAAATSLDVAGQIAKIDAKYPFTPDFHDATMSGKADVCWIANDSRGKANAPKVEAVDQDLLAKFNSIVDVSTLEVIVEKALKSQGGSTDKTRFKLNFLEFEAITERPALVSEANFGDGIFNNQSRFLDIAKDNIFHVKVLAAQLREQALLGEATTDQHFHDCLRRMWALVAIMHGCAREASLWLTVMDSLLEDLARLIRGQTDPRLTTAKMERLRKLRKAGGDPQAFAPLSQAEIESLERDDLARRLFAELARFYRGAILLTYAAASYKAKGKDLIWHNNLVQWSSICGDEACVERLAVRQVPLPQKKEAGPSKGKGKGKAKEDVDPDAMDIDTPVKLGRGASDIIARTKFGVSVGVHDTRLGFPDERSEISKNREWAYPCLQVLIHNCKWHGGFGPFFHYFAHLYHASCQPHRGKVGLIMTTESAWQGTDET